ncbi:MAG: hypothetical protein HQL66_14665 [Magnetococcales bacterium]|nr:hypothetical protein [Magnetococcales bacterium]
MTTRPTPTPTPGAPPGIRAGGERPASDGEEITGPALSHDAVRVLDHLKRGVMQTDELARSCQLTAAMLSRILLHLELAGVVVRLPGNLFSLKEAR